MGTGYLESGKKVTIDGDGYIVRRQIDKIWQFENPRNGMFKSLEQDEILRMLAEGHLVLVSDGIVRQIVKSSLDLPPEAEETAKVRRAYAEATKHLPNSLTIFEPVIQEVWKRIQQPPDIPSFTTVWRWKVRYLGAGQDIRSLADKSAAKGRRGPRYPTEVIRFCEQAIESCYMQRVGNSIELTLQKAQYLVNQENKLRVEADQLPLPTRRMLRRMTGRIPEFDKYAAREGYTAARQRFRWVKGHITASRPLERAEIDHTRLDLFVVDDHLNSVLERPTITACIDVYTRMVLGIYIGFKDPSYYAVQRCLRQCLLPKVNLKDEFPSLVNEWPTYGVMENLVCDNGLEFHGTSLERACGNLNINLMIAPRREPQAKGIIERFLGTLNTAIAHRAPGSTFSNIFQKGDYNSQKEACVTLSDLRHAIWKWIVDVYHQKPHSTLGCSPMAMWQSSATLAEIQLPDDAIGPLDVHLGRAADVTLTHAGIRFDGLQYNSRELGKLRKLHGARLPVQIRVNDDDLGSVWVLCPQLNEPVKADALNQHYAKGLTYTQHQVYKASRAKDPKAAPDVKGLIEASEQVGLILQGKLAQTPSKLGKNYATFVERARMEETTPNSREGAQRNPTVDEVFRSTETQDAGKSALLDDVVESRQISARSERPIKRFKPILKQGYDIE